MAIDAERDCASLIVIGRFTTPYAVVAGSGIAVNENIAWLPSSSNAWARAPPIADKSPVTASPVLAGFVPGVTDTVRTAGLPAKIAGGDAAPLPLGSVGPPTMPCGVREKSSTASPSSDPVTSKSVQRIHNAPPFGMSRPVIVPLSTKSQPSGRLLDVPLDASVSKSCVYV